jgi:hypothetical protein
MITDTHLHIVITFVVLYYFDSSCCYGPRVDRRHENRNINLSSSFNIVLFILQHWRAWSRASISLASFRHFRFADSLNRCHNFPVLMFVPLLPESYRSFLLEPCLKTMSHKRCKRSSMKVAGNLYHNFFRLIYQICSPKARSY